MYFTIDSCIDDTVFFFGPLCVIIRGYKSDEEDYGILGSDQFQLAFFSGPSNLASYYSGQ